MNSALLNLSRSVQELTEENQSLKEDLARVLSNSPTVSKTKGLSPPRGAHGGPPQGSPGPGLSCEPKCTGLKVRVSCPAVSPRGDCACHVPSRPWGQSWERACRRVPWG
jgi:hypothetical protein